MMIGEVVEFKVLGPVDVVDRSRSIVIRAAKPRALLAVLLCSANTPVSVDRLVAALWGDNPPRTAAENVRLYVHQLRRALRETDRIVRRGAGYALLARTVELDAARFEELARHGQDLLVKGDPARAADVLQEGLALWRGMPFADLDHVAVLRDEADRLAERRQAVLETRIEADLALGRHHELVAELSQLVTQHPLRERLRGQLMTALYRSGRQTEALAVYRDTRQVLADEFGLEPGRELRMLEQSILTGDPDLDPPPRTNLDPPPRTHLDPPLHTHNGSAARRRLVPRQLPAYTPHFVGREAELFQLTTLLDTAASSGTVGISTISGTGGMGKTALAVYWAHRNAASFPDGQLYVNLRGFDPNSAPMPPAAALCVLLTALGVPPEQIPNDLDARTALYRSVIADQKVLVLLDNARDVDQVRPLLPGCAGGLTVITSRSRLYGLVAHEGARVLTLGVLSAHESIALLASYLGTDRIGVERRAARELVEHCARLPLALAIVAARAAANAAFPLRLLAEELADEQRRLDALDAGDTTTSVRAVFSLSYQYLSAGAARLFRLLGLHPGPTIALAAAASLAGMPVAAARTALGELTRAHLVDQHSPSRLTLHDLVRTYAGERTHAVDSEPERRGALHRMLAHYLHTAAVADRLLDPHRDRIPMPAPAPDVAVPEVSTDEQAWAWFEEEYSALLAVVAHAADSGFHSYAWQICWLLATYLERRGLWEEWDATAEIASRVAHRAGDVDGQGRSHLGRARANALLGRYPQAHPHLRRALELYRRLGDPVQQAHAHYALSWVLEHEGRLQAAIAEAERALTHFRYADHRVGQARGLNLVGWQRAKLGEYERALRNCRRALDLHLELDDRLGAAHTWDSLAYTHHNRDEHTTAIDYYRNAIALYRQLRNSYYEAGTLARLGDAQHAAGRTSAAHHSWVEAARMLDELGHPHAEQIRAKLAVSVSR